MNKLNVNVVGTNGEEYEYEDVQFVSLVNGQTYGKPALISDVEVKTEADGHPFTVVYVNPENTIAFEVERVK